MRRAAVIGTMIAAMLVCGLLLVPIVGASTRAAPALQTTGTAAVTAAATTAATAAATTAATAAAPSAATATTAPGTLPRTGGDSGMSMILLAAAALIILGVAGATLMASRRSTRL